MQIAKLTLEQKRQKIREKVKNFTLMDDNFMTVFFNDDLECTEFVLQVIMDKPDLKVTKTKSQYTIANLKGRAARLDVRAVDSKGVIYDIEIQRADKGAGAKRARYNSALMDADETVSGMDTETLPETYVIFITENDVLGGELPLYHIDRTIRELNKPFDDKSHIIYVNGQYRGNDPIGSLMHDFSCTQADDMKNKVLANKARLLKESEQGESQMCRAVEELVEEFAAAEKVETAIKMLEQNRIKEDELADFFGFTPEQVQEVLSLYKQSSAVKA